ncbi:uncharacterized protein AMSG_03494 [Thecamonas trahens ATCC 50062]|uniref:Uncharacterized protein n=1 Tax=Thecamonas trahens ATCC 50062 TaxID=461836 RepID=A0A0L0D4B7_THETB|nr:hypothetical protein AMSG_03494 [Thecamonas trahens ATCC 50062]KNC47070.1 hypothetical protein AMSG_03494 [Thecamonas trahens ATCC 50062]|eukprot:XP_013759850.1 hypothetical protein AMSG_03494 [Thecamonas trahens ATCC 50062]
MRVAVATTSVAIAAEVRRALAPLGITVVPLPLARPTARMIASAAVYAPRGELATGNACGSGGGSGGGGRSGGNGGGGVVAAASSSLLLRTASMPIPGEPGAWTASLGHAGDSDASSLPAQLGSPVPSSSRRTAYHALLTEPALPELGRVLATPRAPAVALWCPDSTPRLGALVAGLVEAYPGVHVVDSGVVDDAARWLASACYPVPRPLPEHRPSLILYAEPRHGSALRSALDAYWHVSRTELGFNDAHLYAMPHISLTSFFKVPYGMRDSMLAVVEWMLATYGAPAGLSLNGLVQNDMHVVLSVAGAPLVTFVDALIPIVTTSFQRRVEIKPKTASHITLAKNYAAVHYVDLYDLALRLGLGLDPSTSPHAVPPLADFDLVLYERLPISEEAAHRREYHLPCEPLPLAELARWPLPQAQP